MSETQVDVTPTEATPEAPPTDTPSQDDPGKSPDANLAQDPGPDQPTPTPATWPEDWRDRFAGDNEDDLKTLGRFTTPENVWKQNKELRKKMSSGEYTRARPDPEDEKGMAAWREENGVPESYEGYLENIEVEESDLPVFDEYLQEMWQHGATQDEVKRGIEAFYNGKERAEEAQNEFDRNHRNESEDTLRSEWGPEYRPNLNAMHAMLDAHAPEGFKDAFMSARLPDGSLLGNSVEALQTLVGMAKELNPHGTVTPTEGKTPLETIASRKTEIEVLMTDRNSIYWKGPQADALQAEYRNLLDMEDKYAERAR